MAPLYEKYASFFEIAAKNRRWQTYLRDQVYFLSLDAEWHEVAGRNTVLSYQVCTVSNEAEQNIIEYMEPGQRLSLAQIVSLGVRSVHGGAIPDSHRHSPSLIVLISHHVAAEWSTLSDRMADHILGKITVVRKSPITGPNPIELIVDENFPVHIKIFDTRLLAPGTHQKLSELSKLLGDESAEKIQIPHYYKKRMNLYLRDHPEKFREYAMQDSRATAELFFVLQTALMKLAGREQLFRTLASAALVGYLNKAKNFAAYQRALRTKSFDPAFKLLRRGYFGGRNECYAAGRSDHPKLAGRLWCDVDLTGAYPTAMALCPTIDCGVNPLRLKTPKPFLDKLLKELWVQVDHIPLRYHLSERSDKQLQDLNINPGYYRQARASLHRQHLIGDPVKQGRELRQESDFEATLARIRKEGGKDQAEKIRQVALVVDNSLIDKWHRSWLDAKASNDVRIKEWLVPGVARIRFDFGGKTQYPSLAVRHVKYGLIYPQKGETLATAAEIVLALEAGCQVEALTSVELPILYGEDGLPQRLFLDHLARLTKERKAQKEQAGDETLDKEERDKASIYERLLKEFVNSFYGKTAQAINYRETYDPATGEMQPLGRSPITEASAACMTTGLVRATLSAMLLAVEKFNAGKPPEKRIVAVSATTDGALLGLPRPEGIDLLNGHYLKDTDDGTKQIKYYKRKDNGIKFNDDDVKFPDILKRCGCEELLEILDSYLPVQQMRRSRMLLTKPDEPAEDVPLLTSGDQEEPQGDDTILELKSLCDGIWSVKTRGQIGWVNDGENKIVTLLARFGHRAPLSELVMEGADPEGMTLEELKQREETYQTLYEGGGSNRNSVEGAWLMRQLERIEGGEEEIFDYKFFGLTSFSNIIKGKPEADLTQKIARRRFNGSFDWKRKLVVREGAIDPISVPFDTIEEMRTYRDQMQAERRRGRNATPKTVLHRVDVRYRSIRMRGGEPATVTRQFLRGILHGIIPWKRRKESAADIAARVNLVWAALELTVKEREGQPPFTRDDVENDRRTDPAKYERGVIMPTPKLLDLADALAKEFGVDPEEVQDAIFAGEHQEALNRGLAMQVARAVLNAPGMGLLPFKELYLAGQLPSQAGLVRALRPYLTEQDVAACAAGNFHANGCEAMDRPTIERMFRRLGIPPGKALACARVLAPPARKAAKLPKNPAATQCLEAFVAAVTQPDVVTRPIDPTKLWDRLRWYGLRKRQIYPLSQRRFEGRSLSDTAANRRQIVKMAEIMELDPEPILDAVIDAK